MAKKVEA